MDLVAAIHIHRRVLVDFATTLFLRLNSLGIILVFAYGCDYWTWCRSRWFLFSAHYAVKSEIHNITIIVRLFTLKVLTISNWASYFFVLLFIVTDSWWSKRVYFVIILLNKVLKSLFFFDWPYFCCKSLSSTL